MALSHAPGLAGEASAGACKFKGRSNQHSGVGKTPALSLPHSFKLNIFNTRSWLSEDCKLQVASAANFLSKQHAHQAKACGEGAARTAGTQSIVGPVRI